MEETTLCPQRPVGCTGGDSGTMMGGGYQISTCGGIVELRGHVFVDGVVARSLCLIRWASCRESLV